MKEKTIILHYDRKKIFLLGIPALILLATGWALGFNTVGMHPLGLWFLAALFTFMTFYLVHIIYHLAYDDGVISLFDGAIKMIEEQLIELDRLQQENARLKKVLLEDEDEVRPRDSQVL